MKNFWEFLSKLVIAAAIIIAAILIVKAINAATEDICDHLNWIANEIHNIP